jgi:hypothetical protein
MECARTDYNDGHKELCKIMNAQRIAVEEREAESKKT